jgi:hypothetical protein
MAEGSDSPGRALGLPYDGVKSRQVQGQIAEKRMAKERNARLHPMSGAGRIKDDASTDDEQYEFKHVQKSHQLHGWDLFALFRRAIRQDKEPIYVIYFENVDLTAEVRITKGRKK